MALVLNDSVCVCSLVIGYYAYFLWQIEDDEEQEAAEVWPAAMVAAF